MSLKSRLSEAWDVLFNKANPIKKGCAKIGSKYYSAVYGEISYEVYKEWEDAMTTIEQTMALIRRQKPIKSKDLWPYYEARIIERRHTP